MLQREANSTFLQVLLVLGLFWTHQTIAQPSLHAACSTDDDDGVGGIGGSLFNNFPIFGEDCQEGESSSNSGSLQSAANNLVSDIFSRTQNTASDIIGSVAKDIFVPFNVPGGDATANIEEPEPEVEVESNPNRPEGDWVFIIDTTVAVSAREAWGTMRKFGHILLYGLAGVEQDFRSEDAKGKKWIIDVRDGENIRLEVTETDNAKRFHLVKIVSHTSDVFPGVDTSGSVFYIQAVQGNDGNSKLEFGWGGSVSGPRDVAATALGAFGQELVSNLEDRLGETCDSGKNIRTIEGDCNNLSHPKRGAAGHALVRLGSGDPSYPTDDPKDPAGPLHISPRVISNKLCAQSPGIEILEEKAKFLRSECYTATGDDVLWEVCPFDSAQSLSTDREVISKLEWKGLKEHSDYSIILQFSDGSCDLDLLFLCSGTSHLELVGKVCGEKGNRLYHRDACSIKSGSDGVLANSHGLTDMFWTFGQFVDHDLDLTPVAQLADKDQPGFSKNSRPATAEELPISVPENDFFMKSSQMEFERTVLLKDRSRGLHENQHSAYADLGQVYGVDYLRARALRSFSGGRLKVTAGGLPPYNRIEGFGALRAKVDNAPDAEDKFFAVGDIRGNEQTLLLAMHILWIREHNRVCQELAVSFPKWTDESLYQTARAIVIAEYQSILYDEWLPLLLGKGIVPSSQYSYNAGIDCSINAIFSTAAFRFGHSLVGSFLLKLGPGDRASASVERVPLREVFFKPEVVERDGIDPYIRGASWHLCKEMDEKVVDELRNFLFTENVNAGHMDLVSLNIQRGRDMGLPSFNQVRRILNLRPYDKFSEFITDEHLANSCQIVYEDFVEHTDVFFGMIAEKHFGGSLLGETAHKIVTDQFKKVRDADRFFFKALQWDPRIVSAYPRINDIMEGKVRLRDVILRNSKILPTELGSKSTVFQI